MAAFGRILIIVAEGDTCTANFSLLTAHYFAYASEAKSEKVWPLISISEKNSSPMSRKKSYKMYRSRFFPLDMVFVYWYIMDMKDFI